MSIELDGTRPVKPWRTGGDFVDEENACEAFDSMMEAICLFDVEREVRATPFNSNDWRNRKSGRLDRFLVPNQRALDLGWQHGNIAVEIKRSMDNAGQRLCQTLDYRRSLLRPAAGWTTAEFAFLFPYEPQGIGELMSLMKHDRYGGAFVKRNALVFRCGDSDLAIMPLDGSTPTFKKANYGRKRYSR